MDRAERIRADVTNPSNYTPGQLRAALDCVFNLMGDNWRGTFRGGSISFDDVAATSDVAASMLPEIKAEALRAAAVEHYPRSDWEYEVLEEYTNLSFDDWLEHKIEEHENEW